VYRSFTFYTYLVNKYGVDVPTTMLKVEADFMGLRYPLIGGWRERHAEWLNRQLSSSEVESFLATLIRKKRATKTELERRQSPRKIDDLQRRLESLQTGIDFIIGRDFTPLSHDDKRLIKEELEG